MHKRKVYICYKGAPTNQLKKSNTHQAPPTNEWKLLRLGVWWKYQLVGHVRVQGSKLSSFSLRCLSENIPQFYVLSFGMKNWVLCYTYGTGSFTLKWNMGILLTKVTHGLCDPKELRATTSCDNILYLGSGLSNTQLFAGRPRHQRRSQELASPRSGLPIQPTPGKIRVTDNTWSTRSHSIKQALIPSCTANELWG
jgi:hypothetical protein